ncbi:hypothetical protein BLNAU_16784 [Blattamonas nauphoetae]|uniref:Uncharacterized protein n=1 Tax=Blattamonas nauphoetae TaxID=2049346 RepID=A0ABQ9X801_9EUKA|nr:hypothetical protein BLNAU_16784 [Blattamonas nauphoetae]
MIFSGDINQGSLKEIVSSDEDLITLFHTSGLSKSILKQIRYNKVHLSRIVELARLSEICPLISIPSLTEDLPSLFCNFLRHPQPYLIIDHPRDRVSSFPSFMAILCNEMMACAILGVGNAVYETVITNFPAFSESISRRLNPSSSLGYDLGILQRIIEISQNETNPVKRIASFIGFLNNPTMSEGNYDGNHPMNHLSLCLHHTASFLNAHPDLIDSFLETVDISSSPSDTPFRHDRDLNLISILSQSSSPLFTKLSEPLLHPRIRLNTLLSPRSFTDPASSFFRISSTNPAFFRRILESQAKHILDIAIYTAVWISRVTTDSPYEPHCLDFGQGTHNFSVLLKALAEAKMDLTQNSENFNSVPSTLLTLLVLFSASTNDDLSTAAVSVFSNQFGLTTPHTEALLFATPPTFPISDTFTLRHSHKREDSDHEQIASQSVCAEAGRCVLLKSLFDDSYIDDGIKFARMLGIPFAECLVNALHSTTTLPHSFPFFSPELCGLSQQPSVWNDSSRPSALTALTTLADIEISLAFHNSYWGLEMSPTDEERRHTNFVHLFPFLGPDSQTQFLSSFHTFYELKNQKIHHSLDGVVEYLMKMATVNTYSTPIALLKEMRKVAEFHSRFDPVTHSLGPPLTHPSPLELSIGERLRTAEGEERWRLLTQLAVVSSKIPDIAKELMRTENDAQAFFILSAHKIRSTNPFNYLLDENPDPFDRVVELAGHINNLPLVAAALLHIADTVELLNIPFVVNRLIKLEPKQELCDLVLSTLRTIAPLRREGVEEGCAVEKDEVTSQIVDSCLKVLRFLMKCQTFDPTPVIDPLVSMTVTADLSLLHSILIVLQEIEARTRNTPTPFSICRVTAPFRCIHQSSVTQQPLPSIVSSISLSASLDSQQPLTQLLPGLNENLISDIAKTTTEIVCLILEERRTTHSRTLTYDDPFGVSLAQKEIHTTPQQLFLTLHNMILPDNPTSIATSTLLPLAPFLTRILTIVVPSSPDRVEIRSEQDEQSQLLNSLLSLSVMLRVWRNL